MRAFIMVSRRCNRRCAHCYLDFKGERSPDETIEAVKALKRNGNKCVITGAEMLVEPEYLKCYKEAGQDYLMTNGELLVSNPKLWGIIKRAGIKKICISMHLGIEDKLSSVPEVVAAEAVRESVRRGYTTEIETTISSDNYNSIEAMCKKVEGYGADILHLTRFLTRGRGVGMESGKLTEDMVARVMAEVKAAQAKYFGRLAIMTHGDFGPVPDTRGEEKAKNNQYCPAGIGWVAITPDNRVYSCPFLMGRGMEIGTYKDGKINIDRRIYPGNRRCCIAHLEERPSFERI